MGAIYLAYIIINILMLYNFNAFSYQKLQISFNMKEKSMPQLRGKKKEP